LMDPYWWFEMKTTVEISDALLREARKMAAREGVTLRTLIERSLRHVIETKAATPFKLRRATFTGRGLRSKLRDASWNKMKDLIYGGRGA
jgi:Arc/MetJ family transcription regulator